MLIYLLPHLASVSLEKTALCDRKNPALLAAILSFQEQSYSGRLRGHDSLNKQRTTERSKPSIFNNA